MERNTLLLFVLLLLVSTSVQPQEIHRRKNLDDRNEVLGRADNSTSNSQSLLLSESIGITTNYDLCTNSIYLTSILFTDKPIMVSMVRPYLQFPEAQRYIVYSERDAQDIWNHDLVYQQTGGCPQIDINLTGNNQGLIGVVDVQNRLALKSESSNFTVKPTPGVNPAFVFSNDRIFLVSGYNQTIYLFSSDDLGDSFVPVDSVSHYFSNIISSQYEIFKSPNEQHIVILGISERNGQVYAGVPEDEADNMWIIYSDNFGNDWTARTIAVDGKLNIVSDYHTANFAPLFENFSQIKGSVSNDGVIHISANGYGIVFDSPAGTNAIASSFPLLYWNSINDSWVAISDPAIDTVQAISDYFPANSIGQSTPSISISQNGQIVYVIWEGPQFNLSSELDIEDNGAGSFYYWRDLYHAFSLDGGTNWTYAGKLPQMSSDLSEIFGQSASTLQTIDANSYRAHIRYLADQTTGTSVYDGITTDNDIIYTTNHILITSVDDSPVVNNFELSQNYPNPFNPVTTIKYTIPNVTLSGVEGSRVQLRVYDVLGNEIATLVNEVKSAGNYEVEFNAKNISSGIYFYKLQAGSFIQTKKMVVLK